MLGVALLLVLVLTSEPMTPHITPWGRLLLRAILVALLLAGISAAEAQDVPTMLARVCWSEAGLRSRRTGECAALHRSLVNKADARAVPYAEHMRAYASKVFNPLRPDNRRWLANLWPDGRRPVGWDVRGRDGRPLPWRNSRGAWLRLVEHARHLLETNPNPCWGEPLDWGVEPAVSRYLHRNRRAVVVHCGPLPMCGGTVNVFLRPSPEPYSADPG